MGGAKVKNPVHVISGFLIQMPSNHFKSEKKPNDESVPNFGVQHEYNDSQATSIERVAQIKPEHRTMKFMIVAIKNPSFQKSGHLAKGL